MAVSACVVFTGSIYGQWKHHQCHADKRSVDGDSDQIGTCPHTVAGTAHILLACFSQLVLAGPCKAKLSHVMTTVLHSVNISQPAGSKFNSAGSIVSPLPAVHMRHLLLPGMFVVSSQLLTG